jgi:non-homologous end joining protein Ku
MLQQRLREEAERKEQERETVQLTPEEIQKLQEESDLRVAMETFGVCNSLL